MNKQGILLIISGPSGSGKGTIVERLCEKNNFSLSISATTRKPREYEKDGVHYFFHTREEFEKMRDRKELLEWAEFCGLTFLPCDCPAKKLENDTKRAEIKQMIASLASRNPQIEANIFNAVKNVDTGKLLGWRDENGRHSFLDRL